MMSGTTPFYNKNRRYMYHCIVNVRPTFPRFFSSEAQVGHASHETRESSEWLLLTWCMLLAAGSIC
jgi:hypothetical protein